MHRIALHAALWAALIGIAAPIAFADDDQPETKRVRIVIKDGETAVKKKTDVTIRGVVRGEDGKPIEGAIVVAPASKKVVVIRAHEEKQDDESPLAAILEWLEKNEDLRAHLGELGVDAKGLAGFLGDLGVDAEGLAGLLGGAMADDGHHGKMFRVERAEPAVAIEQFVVGPMSGHGVEHGGMSHGGGEDGATRTFSFFGTEGDHSGFHGAQHCPCCGHPMEHGARHPMIGRGHMMGRRNKGRRDMGRRMRRFARGPRFGMHGPHDDGPRGHGRMGMGHGHGPMMGGSSHGDDFKRVLDLLERIMAHHGETPKASVAIAKQSKPAVIIARRAEPAVAIAKRAGPETAKRARPAPGVRRGMVGRRGGMRGMGGPGRARGGMNPDNAGAGIDAIRMQLQMMRKQLDALGRQLDALAGAQGADHATADETPAMGLRIRGHDGQVPNLDDLPESVRKQIKKAMKRYHAMGSDK